MKAKSILSIHSYSFRSQSPSIRDVGICVHDVLLGLSQIDVIFNCPIHFNGTRDLQLDMRKQNIEDEIAQAILDTYWDEITKYEKNGRPTIDYKRENDGFSFNAKFLSESKKRFAFNLGMGYMNDGISLYNFEREIQYEFEWYKLVFEKIVLLTKPFYGTVKISDAPTIKFYNQLNIKYPIGWITFFSNEFKPVIPDDLSEVRYEYVSGGKYLYTSDEDFLKDKDSYFGYREKLRRIITEIKERVPEFSTESLS